jgi:hypothetical protein
MRRTAGAGTGSPMVPENGFATGGLVAAPRLLALHGPPPLFLSPSAIRFLTGKGEAPAIQVSINLNVLIEVFDAATERKLREIRTKNLFLNSGRKQIRDLLMFPDQVFSPVFTINFMEVGSSGTATTAGMAALIDPAFRKALTRKLPTDYGGIFQMYLAPTESNGRDLREAALYSMASGGLAWARTTHTLITKTSAISVVYSWSFGITAS